MASRPASGCSGSNGFSRANTSATNQSPAGAVHASTPSRTRHPTSGIALVEARRAVCAPGRPRPPMTEQSPVRRQGARMPLPATRRRDAAHLAALHVRSRPADGLQDRCAKRVILKARGHAALAACCQKPAEQVPPCRREQRRIARVGGAFRMVRVAEHDLPHALVARVGRAARRCGRGRSVRPPTNKTAPVRTNGAAHGRRPPKPPNHPLPGMCCSGMVRARSRVGEANGGTNPARAPWNNRCFPWTFTRPGPHGALWRRPLEAMAAPRDPPGPTGDGIPPPAPPGRREIARNPTAGRHGSACSSHVRFARGVPGPL